MFGAAKFVSVEIQSQLALSLSGYGLGFLRRSTGRTALVSSVRTACFPELIGNSKPRLKEDHAHATVVGSGLLSKVVS